MAPSPNTDLPRADSAPLPLMRRPAAIIAIHWATALVGVAVIALILAHEQAESKALRAWLLDGHRAFGALVIALTLARIAYRVRHHPLAESAAAAFAHRALIGLVHLSLYGLLLAVPMLGWALTSARGQAVSLFGVGTLPALIARDVDLGDTLADVHEWAAWSLLAMVGLHVAAALWHHFVRRDAVLLAMLPGRASARAGAPAMVRTNTSLSSDSNVA